MDKKNDYCWNYTLMFIETFAHRQLFLVFFFWHAQNKQTFRNELFFLSQRTIAHWFPSMIRTCARLTRLCRSAIRPGRVWPQDLRSQLNAGSSVWREIYAWDSRKPKKNIGWNFNTHVRQSIGHHHPFDSVSQWPEWPAAGLVPGKSARSLFLNTALYSTVSAVRRERRRICQIDRAPRRHPKWTESRAAIGNPKSSPNDAWPHRRNLAPLGRSIHKNSSHKIQKQKVRETQSRTDLSISLCWHPSISQWFSFAVGWKVFVGWRLNFYGHYSIRVEQRSESGGETRLSDVSVCVSVCYIQISPIGRTTHYGSE